MTVVLEFFYFEKIPTDGNAGGVRANGEQAKLAFAACSGCSVSKLICFDIKLKVCWLRILCCIFMRGSSP